MGIYVPFGVNDNFSLRYAQFKNNKIGTGGWTILSSGNGSVKPNSDFEKKIAELHRHYFKCRSGSELSGVFELANDNEQIVLNNETTSSIFLGLFLVAAEICQKRNFKDSWASITVTGDLKYSENGEWKLVSVGGIDKKYNAVTEYAVLNSDNSDNRKHLFLYIGDGSEILLDDNQNIHIESFHEKENTLDDVIEFIFKPHSMSTGLPEHIDSASWQADLYHSIADHLPGAFVETKDFRKIINEMVNHSGFRGYFIWGENETGKTALAGAIARFFVQTKKADAPVWVTIDDDIKTFFDYNNKFDYIKESVNSYIIGKINERLGNTHEITTVEELKHFLIKQKYVIVFDNLQLDEKSNSELVTIVKELIAPTNFIVTCHTKYTGFEQEIIPISMPDPVFNDDELGLFLELVLKDKGGTTGLKKNPADYDRLIHLLQENIGAFPGLVLLLMPSFINLPVRKIIEEFENLDTVFEISKNEHITKKMENIYLKLMEMLSSEARDMLFIMLNFPPHNDISKEKLLGDLEEAQSIYIFNKLIIKIKKHLPFFNLDRRLNLAIQELCNKNILHNRTTFEEPKYFIKNFTFDILMNSGKLSFNGRREKLVDPRFLLVESLKTNPDKKIIRMILKHLKKRKMLIDEIRDKQESTPLHLAAIYDVDPEVINLLINKGRADVNAENSEKQTPFHYAAEFCSGIKTLMVLQMANADINKTDNFDFIPFSYAVGSNKHIEVIQWFLDNGYDDYINTERTYSVSMHLISANNENPEVIKFLVNKGYSIDVPDDKELLPFHYAAAYNNKEVAELFVRERYNNNTTNSHNVTALHFAAAWNSLDVVKTIYEGNKNDINQKDENSLLPFHYAVMYNDDPEVIEYLINLTNDVYINVNKRLIYFKYIRLDKINFYKDETDLIMYEIDKRINHPLSPVILTAMYNKNIKILNYFLSNGYNFTEKDKELYLFHFASAYNENQDVLKKLLDYGFDIDKRNDNGYRPVHFAAAFNHNPEIIRWFHGKTDFNDSSNITEMTPIQYAASNNKDLSILDCFFNMEYQDIPDKYDRFLLHYAARDNPDGDVIRYLIERDRNKLNAPDSSNYTPLMLAAMQNRSLEILKIFIEEYFCDPKIVDDDGYTLLHLAVSNTSLLLYKDVPYNGLVDELDDEKILYLNNEKFFQRKYDTPSKDGITPLHLTAKLQRLHFLQLFLPAKNGLELPDDYGNKAIHYSAQNPDISVIKWLIDEWNCDIHEKNEFDRNVAHCAALNKNPDIFTFLVQKGVDIKCLDKEENSVLHYSAQNSDLSVIKLLVDELNFDIHNKNKLKQNVAHLAASNENPEMFIYLAQKGVDLNCPDYGGKTPLYIAKPRSDWNFIKSSLTSNGII